jgi:two-component system cell cycle response regulator
LLAFFVVLAHTRAVKYYRVVTDKDNSPPQPENAPHFQPVTITKERKTVRTKILIADDSVVSRRLLRGMLNDRGYSVTEVQDGVAALQELQKSDAPKLAILDWMMPGLNGTEVVQQLRMAGCESYTYVLLLTAQTEKSDIVAGLDSGADDYLTKPFDAPELRARLRVGEQIVHLQERLRCALAASEFRASHDALTGVYNRGTIVGLLEREAGRCLREGKTLGAIFADVDRFKSINDAYGSGAGDQVLLEVAGRMQSALRSYDFLGRYGGEEFLIVLPDCGDKDVQHIAERLRQAVSRSPARAGNMSVAVTLSFGATTTNVSENTGALLHRADLALYDAKEAGGNIVKFEPEQGFRLAVPTPLLLQPPSEILGSNVVIE